MSKENKQAEAGPNKLNFIKKILKKGANQRIHTQAVAKSSINLKGIYREAVKAIHTNTNSKQISQYVKEIPLKQHTVQILQN